MNKKIVLKTRDFADMIDFPIRIDSFVSAADKSLSRARVAKLIDQGMVFVNEKKVLKASSNLYSGDSVLVNIPEAIDLSLIPKDLALKMVYEDDDYIIIDKPAGLTVHPTDSQIDGSDNMVKGLIFMLKGKLSGIGGVKRPGIVHRLDRDTSGLIVVAKHDQAHRLISDMFKGRMVNKVYLALIVGVMDKDNGVINAPIGRSRANRKKMTINGINARDSITEFKVKNIYKDDEGNKYSLLEINLKTGRTHQIRVHFTSIGHPLIGDKLYGMKKLNNIFEKNYFLNRQFLHAHKLEFIQPISKKKVELISALPNDLNKVLKGLKII